MIFEDVCKSKFPYYFDLLDVFGDRASAKPIFNLDNLSTLSTDSEEEEEGHNNVENVGVKTNIYAMIDIDNSNIQHNNQHNNGLLVNENMRTPKKKKN